MEEETMLGRDGKDILHMMRVDPYRISLSGFCPSRCPACFIVIRVCVIYKLPSLVDHFWGRADGYQADPHLSPFFPPKINVCVLNVKRLAATELNSRIHPSPGILQTNALSLKLLCCASGFNSDLEGQLNYRKKDLQQF
jgi:hypothetical protein